MLADASVDVVHITSPNDEHPAQAEAALKAGKHVICEKPLALTSTETDRLRTVAGDSGLVAAVNFNIRFYPQVHEMRSRIRDNGIGTPFLVTGSYLQDWLLYDTDWNWRVERHRGGDLRGGGGIGSPPGALPHLRAGDAPPGGPGGIPHLFARKEPAAGARRDLHQWGLGHDHRCDDNI